MMILHEWVTQDIITEQAHQQRGREGSGGSGEDLNHWNWNKPVAPPVSLGAYEGPVFCSEWIHQELPHLRGP